MSKKHKLYTACGFVLAITLQLLAVNPAQAGKFFTIKDGQLERPTGYREWIYVGTPLTPNDMNDGKAAFPEFHNVYIDPVSWAYWKDNGKFRDGTIIIKELVGVGSQSCGKWQRLFYGGLCRTRSNN